MQVFVQRSELTSAPDEVVHVLASYDDGSIISPTAHGTSATFMSLPNSAQQSGGVPVLINGWRDGNATQVLNFEATNRINTAFPDYSQRNANNELNGYIIQYGTDEGTWPAAAQGRKAEMDRCWSYVNAVRAAANSMSQSTLPADPTDDSHWPTVISPYVPQQ